MEKCTNQARPELKENEVKIETLEQVVGGTDEDITDNTHPCREPVGGHRKQLSNEAVLAF